MLQFHCNCFQFVDDELGRPWLVTKHGLRRCIYCGHEHPSVFPCDECGEVVCPFHTLDKGPHRCRCWTTAAFYQKWDRNVEGYRLLSTRDDAVLSLFFVSIGGYCQEDWFPETQLPEQVSASPQMPVVDAMRLSPACFVALHRSFIASGHNPCLRLTDIAWRLRGDVFHITGDTTWRTNDLLPLSVHRDLGEHE